MNNTPTIDHAVVLGSSMAGMLAAAALARHARLVTVIDRDALASEPRNRKGTPQDHQAHLLLDRGRVAIEHLLPGLFDELVEHGSLQVDMGRAMQWYHYGRWKVRCDTPYQIYLQTRPFLEHHIRRRLRALTNVQLRPRTEALEPSVVDGHVRGIGLRSIEDGSTTAETCDLLVDATGRGSRSPQWLETLGYGQVREERTTVGLGYASRLYRRPQAGPDWSCYALHGTRPSQTRHGVVLAVEDDRWLVLVAGYAGDHPPRDPEGFDDFARSLERKDLHGFVQGLEPLSEPQLYKFPHQHWVHYEELRRLPSGFAVVGDAVCSFDPIFGQGMSVAAMQAEALERQLARGKGFATEAFVRACARLIKNPWLMAVSEAMRYPSSQGTAPPGLPLLYRFLDRVYDCSTTDPEVYRAFLDVMHLHAGLEALISPRVLWRLWRGQPAAPGADAPVRDPG